MHPADPISQHFRLMQPQVRALKKLGLETLGDLLYHFPFRYDTETEIKTVASAQPRETVTLYGRVHGLKTRKAWVRKIAMSEGTLTDDTGSISLVWFNQPYIAKMVHEGAAVEVRGKISEKRKTKTLYISNPEIKLTQNVSDQSDQSEKSPKNLFGEASTNFGLPVYAESRGITSRWFYWALQKMFAGGILQSPDLADPLPPELLKKFSLPSLATALIWVHTPQNENDSLAARKRFAFEEIFTIQLQKQRERREAEKKPAFKISKTLTDLDPFLKRFPFEPTAAQKKAITDILADMNRGHAMSRLLEGDVGSGKTAVAAATMYAVTTTRPTNSKSGKAQDFGALQTAYMAPTEILATQHFESFIQYFGHMSQAGINIGLITSSGCKKFPSKSSPGKATDISRAQLLKWVASGEIPILIGTHSLIQKEVRFKNLAYIIIDEQHRFGTSQRQKLRRKDDIVPHLLSMTATPIPRTLALTVYGDLDLTLLDQMPAGRKPVETKIVLPNERAAVYKKIESELAAGRQAYVICPRIDEPDPEKELTLNVKSVTEEAARLERDVFPKHEIGILHSKMNTADKDYVMREFKEGRIDILVATSVVEVGVNVPNATVILIEGAERFGLAQLHQLRGRVLRSSHQAYCYVFTESKTGKAADRLNALATAKNGFELAEFDLAQRGAGQLYGRKQWGISDLAMEGIRNIKMVEAARTEAAALVAADPALSRPEHAALKTKVNRIAADLHFE